MKSLKLFAILLLFAAFGDGERFYRSNQSIWNDLRGVRR